jgi:two-component system, chemotaxis family, protein-glutamate methylesterase/glutaminase
VHALARRRRPEAAPEAPEVRPKVPARIDAPGAARLTPPPVAARGGGPEGFRRIVGPVVPPPVARPQTAPARASFKPIELLVIGVSTGGPNALARLLPGLPAGLPVPVLIVQHMPPLFTRMLAERLDQLCPLKVSEAVAGAVLIAGEVWVARGDWHMEVVREGRRLQLTEHQGPQVNSCRPAVDPLFSSAVRACGGGVLGVVLTGMGHDGLKGAREIRGAGGTVLAQDEESSVVWGMPGAVANAGVADAVLPLDALAGQILQVLRPARLPEGRAGACR